MKRKAILQALFYTLLLMVMLPMLGHAQVPPDPGGDPFGAPVNGGIAAITVLAFIYGVYRIINLNKAKGAGRAGK